MNFKAIFAATIASFSFATAASATPVTVTLNAPAFNYIGGYWSQGAHISGSVTFDSALLDTKGSGYVDTNSSKINSSIVWSFTDGLNTFKNTNTFTNFDIGLNLVNFVVTGWNIDTTYGVTPWSDIFLNSTGANVSYYHNVYASGANATSSNWTVTREANVPEPSSLALFGLAIAGAAVIRRRKA